MNEQQLTEADLIPSTLVRGPGGCDYRIITVALQSEPPARLVIYRDKSIRGVWARPVADFLRLFSLVKRAPTHEDMERASAASAEWYDGAIARGEIP